MKLSDYLVPEVEGCPAEGISYRTAILPDHNTVVFLVDVHSLVIDILEFLQFFTDLAKTGDLLSINLPTSVDPEQSAYWLKYFAEGALQLGWESKGSSPNLTLNLILTARTTDYSFVRANDFRLDSRAVFEEVFKVNATEEFWEWKYPPSQNRLSLLATRNDEVIAHYGLLERPYYYMSETFRAAQSCDVAVKSDSRTNFAGGVFERICKLAAYNAFSEGVHMIFGFPHKRHMTLGKRVGKYIDGGPVYMLMTHPQSENCQESHKLKLMKPEAVKKPLYDRYYGHLIRSLESEKAGHLDRGYSFFQKRYLSHPEFRYQVYQSEKSLMIVKVAGDRLVLMDYVGAFRSLVQDLPQLHQCATELELNGVALWCSEFFLDFFLSRTPVSIRDQSASIAFGRANGSHRIPDMWVSCGDTDFL